MEGRTRGALLTRRWGRGGPGRPSPGMGRSSWEPGSGGTGAGVVGPPGLGQGSRRRSVGWDLSSPSAAGCDGLSPAAVKRRACAGRG